MSKKKNQTLLWGLIIAFYIGLRLSNGLAIKEPKFYPDTQRYLDSAAQPISSLEFLAGPYPIIVPTLYKIFKSNPNAIAWFQTGISIMAWTWLSFAVMGGIQAGWLKNLAFLAILTLSLERIILLWDWVLLSESLSGSLLALYLGTWFWYLNRHKKRWSDVLVLVIVGLLWTFTRDTNAIFNLGISLLVIIGVVWRQLGQQNKAASNKYDLLLAGILLVGFVTSNHFANLAGRWIGPSMSALGIRVLVDPEKTAFFEAHGMPINAELMSFAGQKAQAIDAGFGNAPALDEFHAWYRANGKTVFAKFILSTPKQSMLAPLQNMSPLFDTVHLTYYKPAGFKQILPPPLESVIFFEQFTPGIFIFSILVFAGGFIFAIKIRKRHWIILLTLIIALYPHAFLIWHVSACDMERHAYQFRLHYNLTIILSLLFMGDAFFIAYQEQLKKLLQPILDILIRFRVLIIILGIFIVGTATFLDFLTGNGADFSIGYAQGAGIIGGLGLIGVGLWLSSKSTLELPSEQ
jgi:hypothetical protein